MSGETPYGSSADQVPVRPAPLRTSSATKSNLVPVADLANPAPELRARNAGSRRRPADRLRDEGGDGIRALVQDRRLERITAAGGTRRPMSAARTPIDVRGRYAWDGHEPIAVCRAVLLARRSGQREEGISVIARRKREHFVLVRPSGLHPVLAGEFERRLDGLRATGEEVGVVEIAGRPRDDLRGERFGRVVREHHPADIGHARGLARHRVADRGHAVPNVHHECPAAPVQVAPACRVE